MGEGLWHCCELLLSWEWLLCCPDLCKRKDVISLGVPASRGDIALLRDSGVLPVGFCHFVRQSCSKVFSNAGKMLPPSGPCCHRCLPRELCLLFPYPEEQQGQRLWLLLVHHYNQPPLLPILSQLAAAGLAFRCGSRGKEAMEIFLTPSSFLCCLCLKPGMDFH